MKRTQRRTRLPAALELLTIACGAALGLALISSAPRATASRAPGSGVIYVATNGSDAPGAGLTTGSPCLTIGFGLTRAVEEGYDRVAVQAGLYAEILDLVEGVDVEGGYDASWVLGDRSDVEHLVRIAGDLDPASDHYVVVNAVSIASPTTLSNVVLLGQNAMGADLRGYTRSSYGVRALHADGLILSNVRIVPGTGAHGAQGTDGADAPQTNTAAGANGGPAAQLSIFCDPDLGGAGGAGGSNPPALAGGSGGRGGMADTFCGFPTDHNATVGAPGASAPGAGSCGDGGAVGPLCTIGRPGNPGVSVHGIGGAGGPEGDFDLVAGVWRTETGADGSLGQHGGGGGGGGGSGGCDNGAADCKGAGGGGGGAGGVRAPSSGTGGGGGGHSVGVLAIDSDVTLADCEIVRSSGGSGGRGGRGALGQPGAAGGNGGSAAGNCWVGGNGGRGGRGGNSGAGGGGAAGSSFSILADPSSTTVASGLSVSIGFPGEPGAGGTGPGVGQSGDCPTPGVDTTGGASGSPGTYESSGSVENVTQGSVWPTISAAVAAAVDGDVLVVQPGLYHEAVDLGSKSITLRGSEPLDPDVVLGTVMVPRGLGASALRVSGSPLPGFPVIDGIAFLDGDNGAVLLEPGAGAISPTFQNCLFSMNRGTVGAAMRVEFDAYPTVEACRFTLNKATDGGGAIWVGDGAGLTLLDSHLGHNSTEGPLSGGGALFLEPSAAAVVMDCAFVANAGRQGGGAIYMLQNDSAISQCRFSNNTASSGGAILVSSGEPSVSLCTFGLNTASNHGGAIACTGDSQQVPSLVVTIDRCAFAENKAPDGGAVYGEGMALRVLRSTFQDNDSQQRGAGVFASHLPLSSVGGTNEYSLVQECRFFGNSAGGTNLSGAVYSQFADTRIRQCLFSGNRSAAVVGHGACYLNVSNSTLWGNSGGGVQASQSACVELLNCILWQNGMFETEEVDEGQILRSFCDVFDSGGDGFALFTDSNFDLDPLFVDPDGPDERVGTSDDDLRLTGDSPCINRGLWPLAWSCQAAADAQLPEEDPDGYPREIGPIDVGYYEYGFDCDGSGVPDYIEIEMGLLQDCNGNFVYDYCEATLDCQVPPNGILDMCDIFANPSLDQNGNGFLDECEVSGTLPPFHWTAGAGADVVVAVGNVRVTGASSIGPGVRVLFTPGSRMTVTTGSQLLVDGVEGDEVTFTSANVAFLRPRAGDWAGLHFEPGSFGVLRHAIVEYALTQGVRATDADLILEDGLIREVAGLDARGGQYPALAGGPAYGIFVTGNVAPVLRGNTIRAVQGGSGGTGRCGPGGMWGAYGLDGAGYGVDDHCALLPNFYAPTGAQGMDGGPGLQGAPGVDGGGGGDAVGIYCGPGTSPTVVGNVVRDVRGGGGGRGGPGGQGGWGGSGGNGDDYFCCSPPIALYACPTLIPPGAGVCYEFTDGGNGGSGGSGGNGGSAGNGGPGGDACGLELDQVVGGVVVQNALAGMSGGPGGDGGRGGPGGASGWGGWGGIGLGNGGCGGDSGNSGNGGAGGHGGQAGDCEGIAIRSNAGLALGLHLNAVAELAVAPGGEAGLGGASGLVGAPGGGNIGNNFCGSGTIPTSEIGAFLLIAKCSVDLAVFIDLLVHSDIDFDPNDPGLGTIEFPDQYGTFFEGLGLPIGIQYGALGAYGTTGNVGTPGLDGSFRAILADGADLGLTNSILASSGSVGLEGINGGSVALEHSILHGFDTPFGSSAFDVVGNLFADPAFVNAPGGDLRLRPVSPAVDAGDGASLPPDSLDLDGDLDFVEPISRDLLGNPRVRGNPLRIVDMGPYERVLVGVEPAVGPPQTAAPRQQ